MPASTVNPLVANAAFTIPPYIDDIEAATPFLVFDIRRDNLSDIQSQLEAVGNASVVMLERATKCDTKGRVVLRVKTTPQAKRKLFAMRALPEFDARPYTLISIGPPKAGFYVDISTTLSDRSHVGGLIDRLAHEARIGPPAKLIINAKGGREDVLTWTFFLGCEESLASQRSEGLADAMSGFLNGDGPLTVVGIAAMQELTQAQRDTHSRPEYSWQPIPAVSDSVIAVQSMVRRFDKIEGLEGAGGIFEGADGEGFGRQKRDLSHNTKLAGWPSGKRRNLVVSPPTSPPVIVSPPTTPPVVVSHPTSPPVVVSHPTSPPVVVSHSTSLPLKEPLFALPTPPSSPAQLQPSSPAQLQPSSPPHLQPSSPPRLQPSSILDPSLLPLPPSPLQEAIRVLEQAEREVEMAKDAYERAIEKRVGWKRICADLRALEHEGSE